MYEFFINNSDVLKTILNYIIFFILGYSLSTIIDYNRLHKSVEKKLLSDTYYAYAIISFKLNCINWYCGNILISSDNYTLLEDSTLEPGFYNGFIHNSIFTIIDLENNKTRSIYLELEEESPIRSLLINSFPVIVIH